MILLVAGTTVFVQPAMLWIVPGLEADMAHPLLLRPRPRLLGLARIMRANVTD